MSTGELYAALDLGSNSFHLLLARRFGDSFETVERLKEKVQLLGAFQDGRLDAAAMARGRACLARFAQRLAEVPHARLRMAGTHALRVAVNRAEFAAAAEQIVGVPLEVVSGEDEARLIYLGVAHHAPWQAGERRVVVDIGGGSTEFAWGAASGTTGRAEAVASVQCGCVSLTDAYFAAAADQRAAYLAARQHATNLLTRLAPVASGTAVLGTSGTIESVQTVLAANGWGDDAITAAGLASLVDAIVSGRWLVEAGLPGLPPDRVDIFPAGVALLDAVFARFGVNTMRFVDASLQDGLLYREVGAPGLESDLRTVTATRLMARCGIDVSQAARVRSTALALFDACADWWDDDAAQRRNLLGWAADLHQVGAVVASRHYHRHGAYLLQHADLPGFSRAEQIQLALLVRGHRRGFPGLAFRAYDDSTRRQLERLLALLRIAVILNRSHSDGHMPEIGAVVSDSELQLRLPVGWLDRHSLSARELEVETGQLEAVGIRLRYA
jgi:exopolyphosphatase / guanosine-5'-triphosphate,3'-diphosphate pyrophosphatase